MTGILFRSEKVMRYVYAIGLFLCCLLCHSQGFKSRLYFQGSKNHMTKGAFETMPGNYIAGGFIYDTVNGQYCNRLCLTGLNSQGQVQWTKKYGHLKFSYFNNYFAYRWFFRQGNYLYFTSSAKDSNNKTVGVLIKFNFNGDTLWQKIYRDTVDQIIPQGACPSVDGGFLITGLFDHPSYQAAMVLKTDGNGNELWRKKIHKADAPDAQDGRAIAQDSLSKRIITVGYQYIGNNDPYDNVLILDSTGNLISRQSYGYRSILFDVIPTHDKKFVAAGVISKGQDGFGYDLYQGYVLKLDIANTNYAAPVRTLQTGISSGISWAMCATELKNHNLLIGGMTDTLVQHNIYPNNRIYHTWISPAGTNIKTNYYDYKTNAPNQNFITLIHTLFPTSDGGLIASIEVQNMVPSNNPFFVVKYDSTGCDSSQAYCAMILSGVSENKLEEEGISMYPNPGTEVLNLSLKNMLSSATVVLSDALGREIKRARLESAESALNIKDLKSGVYFIKINDGDKPIYQNKFIKLD